MTMHRLLRQHPGNSTRFRHHRGNRLPHDLVVVDEASMVSLTMMARLLEAVRPEARLVLVGDPDQLSSIDAGAVLTDLVRGYEHRDDSPVAALTTAHRYGAEIGELAEALRLGDADRAVAALRAGGEAVEWVSDGDPAGTIRSAVLPHALAVHDAAAAGDAGRALAALDRHRLLCAHRDGPYRRTPLEPSHRAVVHLGDRRPDARRRLPRTTDPRLVQRLLARRLQRRHRRRRREPRRARAPPSPPVSASSRSPRPASATWRPCTR